METPARSQPGRAGRPAGTGSIGRGRRFCAIVLLALVALVSCFGRARDGSDTATPTVSVGSPTELGSSPSSSATPTSIVESSVPSATALPTGVTVPFRSVARASAAGKRIGLIGPTAADSFGKAVTDSVSTQLDTAGAAVIRCDSGDDATLVLDCARRLDTQHVDGWIAVQAGNLGDALCAAGPPGVPFFAVEDAPVGCQTGWVGADDHRAGQLVGAALGRSARSNAGCAVAALIVLTDSSHDLVSSARAEGIKDGFAQQCPEATAEPTTLDAGTNTRLDTKFRTAINAVPPDVPILVASVNDAAALAVAAAVPAGRTNRIAWAAIGGDRRARCSLVADPRWLGDAALFPDRYGEVVVPALIDKLNERPVPAAMYVPTTFLTPDNLADYYPDDKCPVS